MMPGTDESTLNMNENRKRGQEARLKMLETVFSQKAAATVKFEIMFNSDGATRAKSGAQPDVTVSARNGFVATTVVGHTGYISSQDTKDSTKSSVAGNTMAIVKNEQITEAGGSAHYVYTVKASVSGNKVTGTWATTRNGKLLFKGTFTADRTASVGEDGSIREAN
jgi:hypothetical protein